VNKRFRLELEGTVYEVEVNGETVLVDGHPFTVKVNGDAVQVNGRPHTVELGDNRAMVDGIAYAFRVIFGEEKPAPARAAPAEAVPEGAGVVRAIMPGKIIAVRVQEGTLIKEGQVVCVLEAMKMENELRAPVSGEVKEVRVAPGADVEMGEVLVVIKPL